MRMIDRIANSLARSEMAAGNSDELTIYQRGFGQAIQAAALILREEGYEPAGAFLFRLSRAQEGSLGEPRGSGQWKEAIRAARQGEVHPGFAKIPELHMFERELAGITGLEAEAMGLAG